MPYSIVDMNLKTVTTPFVYVLKYQREKGTIYLGVKTLENAVTCGARMIAGGQLPPSLYVERGPDVGLNSLHTS